MNDESMSAGSRGQLEHGAEAAAARPVTMQDVAQAAGVSNMTVSNVINGREARVSDATRVRVLKAVEDLNYRVNIPARQLRRGRTGVIGLAVPYLNSLYYSALADRLVNRFAERGYRLVVERTGGALEEQLAALATSHLNAYDGLVLMMTQGRSGDLDRLSPTRPIVVIGEREESRHFDHVRMDNVGGARLATRQLLSSGSRRIALIGGTTDDTQTMPSLRTQGYRLAHEDLGVPVDEELIVPAHFAPSDGCDAVRRILAQGVAFDGVFALTDDAAVGALKALNEAGLDVPRDVQAIGWDDATWGAFTIPSLSSVAPANDEIAEAIVSILLARIDGFTGEKQTVTPRAALHLRESTR